MKQFFSFQANVTAESNKARTTKHEHRRNMIIEFTWFEDPKWFAFCPRFQCTLLHHLSAEAETTKQVKGGSFYWTIPY